MRLRAGLQVRLRPELREADAHAVRETETAQRSQQAGADRPVREGGRLADAGQPVRRRGEQMPSAGVQVLDGHGARIRRPRSAVQFPVREKVIVDNRIQDAKNSKVS